MKFLCVECDVPMSLKETTGPENGSMTVLFTCRSCGREIAMLTNAMETQMVHSLGVKIGGAREAAPPMETIRSSLVGYQGSAGGATVTTAAHLVAEATTATETQVEAGLEENVETAEEKPSGGCPFSEMVVGASESAESHSVNGTGLTWTAEAAERMDRIPSFVRPMVERGIEDYAKSMNVTVVDAGMLKIVREKFGF